MQNGFLIASLRSKFYLTQNDMANILKVSLKTYKLYESNKHSMDLYNINVLSNFFGVSIDSLLNLTKNIESKNNFSNINYRVLAFYLKFWRKKNHIRQCDLAHEFNISVMSVSKYERYPKSVSISYLYLFAKKFNLSLDYICGKTQKKEIL